MKPICRLLSISAALATLVVLSGCDYASYTAGYGHTSHREYYYETPVVYHYEHHHSHHGHYGHHGRHGGRGHRGHHGGGYSRGGYCD